MLRKKWLPNKIISISKSRRFKTVAIQIYFPHCMYRKIQKCITGIQEIEERGLRPSCGLGLKTNAENNQHI